MTRKRKKATVRAETPDMAATAQPVLGMSGLASTYHSYTDSYIGYREPAQVKEALAPLLQRLALYDKLRVQLQREGGDRDDIVRITSVLTEPVHLRGPYAELMVRLIEAGKVRMAVQEIGGFSLKWQVRRFDDSRLPAFYLCRVLRDYWAEYRLVVEDLYRSPGYPMSDERFVQLMSAGHERYYLSLSRFRDRAQELVATHGEPGEQRRVDDLLYTVGRHVLQAAWHEDQRLGVLVARHFEAPLFLQAIELLYLCLSGELCTLRGEVSNTLLAFFERVYPQPAIKSFLQRLPGLDGEALNTLPRRALLLYRQLSSAFAAFLAVRTPVSHLRPEQPLHKCIFANVDRLQLLAGEMAQIERVAAGVGTLEENARQVIEEILRTSTPGGTEQREASLAIQ